MNLKYIITPKHSWPQTESVSQSLLAALAMLILIAGVLALIVMIA